MNIQIFGSKKRQRHKKSTAFFQGTGNPLCDGVFGLEGKDSEKLWAAERKRGFLSFSGSKEERHWKSEKTSRNNFHTAWLLAWPDRVFRRHHAGAGGQGTELVHMNGVMKMKKKIQ